MLAEGDRIPAAEVWTAPQERATLDAFAAGAPMLLLFYLFDWSST
jgi:hypothetical protein